MFSINFMLNGQVNCNETLMVDGDPTTCVAIDMDLVSYETILGSCVPEASNHNAWLAFTADGPDIDIISTHASNANVLFTLVRFTGQDCDPVKYEEIACGINQINEVDILTVGELYHVIVHVEDNVGGDTEVCVYNPDSTPAPANNLPCAAIQLVPDSTCISGTTTYAESDDNLLHCGPEMRNEVWYKFTTGDSLVFGVQVFLHNISMTGDFRVKLIEFGFQDCSQESVIRQQYCGSEFGLALEYVALEPNHEYYVAVASDEETQGDFEICLKQMYADPNTDPCQATEISPNQECITFDTYYSLFEYDLPSCDFSNQKIWYQFYSGEHLDDIDISLSKLEDDESVFIGLGYFQGNFCENNFVWVDSYCGNVQDASLVYDDLLPFQIYHIVIGTNFGFTGEFELCVNGDYNSPYTNGSPCTAYQIDDFAGCVSGSNIYGQTNLQDTFCYGITPITENWYKVPLERYDHSIDVGYTAINTIPVHRIQIGYFENGCLDSFQVQSEFCDIPQESSLSASFPDSIEFAYINLGLPANQEYFFSLCINPLDLSQLCFDGDFCQTALDQGEIELESANCWEACTFGATRENSTNSFTSRYPTSWYSFTTGEEVEMLKLNLEQPTFPSFFIGLKKADECDRDTFDIFRYIQITDLSEWSLGVDANSEYLLAICAISELGATADICIEGLSSNRCPIDDKLSVVNTSMGSPFFGPFQEGEQVSFCYTIESFDVISEFSCQWLQGIVPTFGHSWNQISFDSLGKPISSSNIVSLNSEAEWGWRNDVHSKMDSDYRRLSMSNQGLQICHSDQSECEGVGLHAGDELPAGWYAWNYSQGFMHPDSTYGDGIFCDQNNGPWNVCFDLLVGNLSDDVDLSVDIHTFSDGEIGLGGTPDTSCMADLPLVNSYYMQCDQTPLDSLMQISTCSGNTTTINLPEDQLFFWFYIDNPRVQGETTGSGTELTISLSTDDLAVSTAQYFVQGYSSNGCHLANYEILIDVYPALDIPRPDLFTICQRDSISMQDILPLQDYIIGDFYVDWDSPILEDLPNAFWAGNTDTIIPYQVISAAGCYFQDTIAIHVEDVIVEGEFFPYTVCRDDQLNLQDVIDLNSLIEDPFTVDWDYGNLEDVPNPDTSFMASTEIPFVLTGENGCQYVDVLEITVPFIDVIVLGKNRYCSTDTVSISAGYSFDLPHEKFWIYPNGDTLYSAGIARPAELFQDGTNYLEFHLLTEDGCPFYDYDTIEIYRVPEFTFNQDTFGLGVCSYDSLLLEVELSTDIYDPVWSTPEGTIVSESYFISTPGIYTILSGYQDTTLDCSNTETFDLSHYPEVDTDLTYDEIVCEGDSSVVAFSNSNNIFAWSTGNFSSDEKLPAGEYQVTVSNPDGCKDFFEISVDSQALPNPTFSFVDMICDGDSVWIDTAEDDSYNYLWTDSSDSSAYLSYGGVENVYVTDNLGCLDSFSFEIEVIEVPEVDFSYSTTQDTLFLFDNSTDIGDCQWMINDDLLGIAGDTVLILPEGDYIVSLTCDNQGCTDFQLENITVEVVIVISNKEFEDMPWQLFPNPNSGLFDVEFESERFIEEVEVFDLQGRLHYFQKVESRKKQLEFDAQLVAGTYFLRVQSSKGSEVKVFVVR